MKLNSHLLVLIFNVLSIPFLNAEGQDTPAAAQKFGKMRPAVQVQPDGLYIGEAEEFQPASKGGWQAKKFGENYYAATFANSFLSRQAFLGAPEQCEETVASLKVNIKEAGRYLVLVRYEAAFRFETRSGGAEREARSEPTLRCPRQSQDLGVLSEAEEGSRLELGSRREHRLGGPRRVRLLETWPRDDSPDRRETA